MGGKIWVESTTGKGSVFHFTVKMRAMDAKESTLMQDVCEQPIFQILMVEDDPICAMVQKETLKRRGCVVTHVTNGRAALEAAKQKVYDLILMDVHLPLLDGLEATRQIRADVAFKSNKTPIIAVTADASNKNRSACIESGMNVFAIKPIQKDQIEAIMNRYLPIQQTPFR